MGSPRCETLRGVARIAPLFVLIALACAGCGSDDPESAAPATEEAERALAGAPSPLARLHAQANELLEGGEKAFRRRLDELRGYPVVVNKWASWCPPCRAEFPYFQRQSVALGKRVAFLGVDTNDNDAEAEEFLEEFPVSYPTYKDPSGQVADVFKALVPFPATAFYDRKGRLAYVKFGPYKSDADLAADIRRYAG